MNDCYIIEFVLLLVPYSHLIPLANDRWCNILDIDVLLSCLFFSCCPNVFLYLNVVGILSLGMLRQPSYSTGFGAALNIETLVAAAERRDTPIEVSFACSYMPFLVIFVLYCFFVGFICVSCLLFRLPHQKLKTRSYL